MIVHAVFLEWKRGVDPHAVDEVKRAFLALTGEVPGIREAYWGRTLPGGTHGFSEGVVVLAENEAALAAYRAHPDHQRLTAQLQAMSATMLGENLQT